MSISRARVSPSAWLPARRRTARANSTGSLSWKPIAISCMRLERHRVEVAHRSEVEEPQRPLRVEEEVPRVRVGVVGALVQDLVEERLAAAGWPARRGDR